MKTSGNILEHSIDVADEYEIDVTTIKEINDDELPDENTADTFLELTLVTVINERFDSTTKQINLKGRKMKMPKAVAFLQDDSVISATEE